MPELAEVAGFTKCVNDNAHRTYTSCSKSPVHKLEPVHVPFASFRVRAVSRGKEMILTMTDADPASRKPSMHVRFRFGMTGSMRFYEAGDEVHKHAHFLLKAADGGTLCMVDQRRFGSWEVVDSDSTWGEERGPCPVTEWSDFARNVADNLPSSNAWNKPICETLLDQRFFNGIGNYLRAEIMNECGIDPFAKTSKILANLTPENALRNKLLKLCKTVPEIYFDDTYKELEHTNVYGQPHALKRKDSNGRMVWYSRSNSSTVLVDDEAEDEDSKPVVEPKNKGKKGGKKRRDDGDDAAKSSKSQSKRKKTEEMAIDATKAASKKKAASTTKAAAKNKAPKASGKQKASAPKTTEKKSAAKRRASRKTPSLEPQRRSARLAVY